MSGIEAAAAAAATVRTVPSNGYHAAAAAEQNAMTGVQQTQAQYARSAAPAQLSAPSNGGMSNASSAAAAAAAASSQQRIPQPSPYPQPPSSHSHQHHHQQQQQQNASAGPGPSTEMRRANSSASISSQQMPLPKTAADLMREGPRDYEVLRSMGDGSFGTVVLADWKSPLPDGTEISAMQDDKTRPEWRNKNLVAIKKMKKQYRNWAECLTLKELKVREHTGGFHLAFSQLSCRF